jgi:hypothetical protein
MKNTYVVMRAGITVMLPNILNPLWVIMYNITLYVIQASWSLLPPVMVTRKLCVETADWVTVILL